MKKALGFFRSMRFGMILLVLIIAISFVGSLIQQGQDAAFYQQQYPTWSGVLLALQLDHVFSSWYFVLLLLLLCVNLILCSLTRLPAAIRQYKSARQIAPGAAETPLSSSQRKKVELLLAARRLKATRQEDGATIYHKNSLGYFGSFLMHLSLLLTLVLAACAMYFAVYDDVSIHPGDSHTMADGTAIAVESFRMADETGKLDYVSVLSVTDKHGAASGPREISVNYPLSFGGHKFYQQSYGLAGHLTITNEGQSDDIYLEEPGFLTLDGVNGIMYMTVYPDHTTDEDGHTMPLGDVYNSPALPLYQVMQTDDGEQTGGLVEPGTTLHVGGVYYTFNQPTWYPGIRIKTNPPAVMALLYATFALMLFALWLCFFHVPLAVRLTATGYAVKAKGQSELTAAIAAITKDNKGE